MHVMSFILSSSCVYWITLLAYVDINASSDVCCSLLCLLSYSCNGCKTFQSMFRALIYLYYKNIHSTVDDYRRKASAILERSNPLCACTLIHVISSLDVMDVGLPLFLLALWGILSFRTM